MKGKYTVIIYDKRIRYELTLERQVTVIKGDSGTGKSTLVRMVRSAVEDERSNVVHCNCADKLCVVFRKKNFEEDIKDNPGKIFFIDEDEEYAWTKEFAEAVKDSDNYFVIMSRSGRLKYLTYDVCELSSYRYRNDCGVVVSKNEFNWRRM
jgi:predicted ATPase